MRLFIISKKLLKINMQKRVCFSWLFLFTSSRSRDAFNYSIQEFNAKNNKNIHTQSLDNSIICLFNKISKWCWSCCWSWLAVWLYSCGSPYTFYIQGQCNLRQCQLLLYVQYTLIVSLGSALSPSLNPSS